MTRRQTDPSMVVLAVALCAFAVAVCGCEKPKPPPAPPPPPPPPPRVEAPPAVSFEALAQELKVDPRVQIEPGFSISDEGLARATLRVADALARGDAKALRPLLAQRAGDALGTLEAADQWTGATKSIEAVRILSVGPPPSNLVSGSDPELTTEQAADLTLLTKYMLERFAPEMADRIKPALEEAAQRALAEGGGSTNPAQLKARILSALATQGFAPKRDLKVFSASASHAVLMAVQDPAGAYLCGWQTTKNGDSWVFDGVATRDDVKPRASAWAGIGAAAFDVAGLTLAGAANAAAKKPGDPTDADAPPAPADPNAPLDQKRTPAGPVRIPRPSGPS
ncbi:MAG: hypothetical protein ACKVS8_14270 [Phycisphaerales bacterium]